MTSGIKFELKFKQGKQVFHIVYTPETWKALKGKLEKLGLKKSKTENAWDKAITLEYFRENYAELLKFIREQEHGNHYFIDNINSDFLSEDNEVNIAVLRVIPTKTGQNYVTEIVLQKYLTVANLREIMNALVHAYNVLFNIVTDAVSVEVKVNGV